MRPLLLIPLLAFCTNIMSQSFNDYAQYYPIGEDSNIRLMTNMSDKETILFEANPVLNLSLQNNFIKGLLDESQTHTEAWYVSFQPQLRMFTDNSLPVKTPSYKIFLSTQHLFRLNVTSNENHQFLGFLVQSGHYSNGQDGCAFSPDFKDGAPECDSIFNTFQSTTNLSEILNRRTGNFSTNITKLILNYRSYQLDEDNVAQRMYGLQLGYTLFHDRFLGIGSFGGYSDNDIQIYGKHRFSIRFKFMKVLKQHNDLRYSLTQKLSYIHKPHDDVNQIRAETKATIYPFAQSKTIGFFISYIYGHDNYNYRFVDDGHQFTCGITWSQFPPVQMTSGF